MGTIFCFKKVTVDSKKTYNFKPNIYKTLDFFFLMKSHAIKNATVAEN